MKRISLFFFPIALALLLTACGSTSTTTTSGTSSGTGYGNTNTSTAPTPTPAANATGAILHTTSATVNGKTVTLLTNDQGQTLYYFQPDTATTSACTGGCASTWPPFLSKSLSGSIAGLSGTLTLQSNANGQQVTYNGHPLYTYSGDTSPGQTNGEGIGGKWFVATNDLATNSGSSTSSGY